MYTLKNKESTVRFVKYTKQQRMHYIVICKRKCISLWFNKLMKLLPCLVAFPSSPQAWYMVHEIVEWFSPLLFLLQCMLLHPDHTDWLQSQCTSIFWITNSVDEPNLIVFDVPTHFSQFVTTYLHLVLRIAHVVPNKTALMGVYVNNKRITWLMYDGYI